MIIPNDISMRITKLIEDYCASGSTPPELRLLAFQERVLPLFLDMGGVFGINVDGEIVSYPGDDTINGRRVESDLRIRNLVLFQGTKKYPELKKLIVRPEHARVCPHCGGTGRESYAEKYNIDGIVCYCGGLGWIP